MEDEPRIAAWNAKVDWPLTGLAVAFLASTPGRCSTRRSAREAREASTWCSRASGCCSALDYLVRHHARPATAVASCGRHLLDLAFLLLPMFRPLRALRVITVISVLNRQLRDDSRGRVAIYVGATVALVGFVAALAVLEAERNAPDASITTFGEALWWTITTISTVGYGDRYPVTVEGRLVAATLMVAGIALLGVVTASIAAWFVENLRRASEQVSEEVEEVSADVEAAQVQLADVLAELRTISARLDALERDRRGGDGDAQTRTGQPHPFDRRRGVDRTDPVQRRGDVGLADVGVRHQPDLAGHAAGQHPRVGEPAQRAAHVGDREQHDVGLGVGHGPAALAQARDQQAAPSRGRRPAAPCGPARPGPPLRAPRPGAPRRRASCAAAAPPARTPWIPPPRNRPGAPRPLLKQTWTVSTPTVSVAGGTPSATAACQSRAPSRCTRRPAARAAAATAACSSGAVTVPPAALWVFSRHSSVVRSV